MRDGIASGALQGNETLNATVRLQLGETHLDVTIEDDIKLA